MRPQQPAHISTLSALIAIGLTGFYVGVTNNSITMSYQGTAYLFDNINTPDEAQVFAYKLFALFNDPRVPAEQKADILVSLKPLVDEEKYDILAMLEGPSRAFMFIPNENIQDVLDSADDTDDSAEPVTLH